MYLLSHDAAPSHPRLLHFPFCHFPTSSSLFSHKILFFFLCVSFCFLSLHLHHWFCFHRNALLTRKKEVQDPLPFPGGRVLPAGCGRKGWEEELCKSSVSVQCGAEPPLNTTSIVKHWPHSSLRLTIHTPHITWIPLHTDAVRVNFCFRSRSKFGW